MSTEPIFLTPVLQDKIWGGKKLQTEFGFDLPSERSEKLGLSAPIPMASQPFLLPNNTPVWD